MQIQKNDYVSRQGVQSFVKPPKKTKSYCPAFSYSYRNSTKELIFFSAVVLVLCRIGSLCGNLYFGICGQWAKTQLCLCSTHFCR